ncbi:GNAT family N-acetyltransferase [Streptomyces sedi]|uniref:GNAT family N-acetyltransferase n=1 Tax=Streptomyces sedi TaxID=555059 RepID=A0A5C4UST6_9ACTN|nr:GNAT family protein [Streptomyces sedi]TNM26691.1 GNAT family N-acetyltransferase [Streptomyces sedi]
MNASWSVELALGEVGLRPIRLRDHRAWREVNQRNRDWLRPWEATIPPPPHGHLAPRRPTFRQMVRHLRAEAQSGRMLPFVVTYQGQLAGQLTVAGITWGSMCSAHIGYWVDRSVAGRGVMPAAVALAVDHCFHSLGLHRVEVCIRPENGPSRRVVEKLGFREEGVRPRFLHIDGGWRDHLVFALTAEEVPQGLVRRWRQRNSALSEEGPPPPHRATGDAEGSARDSPPR